MNYKIAAYDVDFPHKAYGVQLGFMDKVLKALDSKANALLEAPTGSGKTLSLLCAALAWQRQQKIDLANFANDAQAKAEPDSDVDEPPESAAPEEKLKPDSKQKQRKRCTRIYYATRTHSQIAQVSFLHWIASRVCMPSKQTCVMRMFQFRWCVSSKGHHIGQKWPSW